MTAKIAEKNTWLFRMGIFLEVLHRLFAGEIGEDGRDDR